MRRIAEAAEASAEAGLDADPLYTSTFRLTQIEPSFAAAERRPDGFIQSVVAIKDS